MGQSGEALAADDARVHMPLSRALGSFSIDTCHSSVLKAASHPTGVVFVWVQCRTALIDLVAAFTLMSVRMDWEMGEKMQEEKHMKCDTHTAVCVIIYEVTF